ncbi:LEC14B protein-like [Hibiscus syriacus]|uniref:LEC14B protein-like n=1 Tax=Hibiscus syriacus TaxID=106335 RepID=UPI001921DEE7|nr:LEC14B protein-like [Hibiscus syriacus]
MLAGREGNYSGRGRFSSADCCHMLSSYFPVNGPWLVDQTTSRAYVSQFSADGSLFVAGFQGSNIRINDVDRGWKVQKNILARSLRWTVTDTSLSPDQRHLVYTSMSPIVHIVNVGSATTESLANVTEIHEGLDFVSHDYRGYSFGLFSVKFSTDGRELVAGSSDNSIYVYDLDSNKLSLRIAAHTADVNTVTFADEGGNLIYSGSDDNLCKVWDRRCFIAKDKPAGVLMGHLEGITFIDSRGDDRYFISNGKDQTIKLWDIRKMSSNTSCNLGLGITNGITDGWTTHHRPEILNTRVTSLWLLIRVTRSCGLLFAVIFPPNRGECSYLLFLDILVKLARYFPSSNSVCVENCGRLQRWVRVKRQKESIRWNRSEMLAVLVCWVHGVRLYAPQFLEGVLRKQTMRGGACIPCMETSAEKRLNLGASPTNVNSSRLLGPFKLGSFTFTYTLLWIVFIIHRLSI